MANRRNNKAAHIIPEDPIFDSVEEREEHEALMLGLEKQETAALTDEQLLTDLDAWKATTVTPSLGVRGTLSKEGFEMLNRYEQITGLSRSEVLDLAVMTLQKMDKEFVMQLIEKSFRDKLQSIADSL